MTRIQINGFFGILIVIISFSSLHASQISVLRSAGIEHTDFSTYDTLSWRKLLEPTSNLWFVSHGDSLAVWFKPAAPCSLIAIRFQPFDIEASTLIQVCDGLKYDGHITTTDSTDSNGWIGYLECDEWIWDGQYICVSGEWIPGPVLGYSPLGWDRMDDTHIIWGPFPYTLTEVLARRWIEVPATLGRPGEIDLGDKPFFVVIIFYITDGLGMAAEQEGTTPFHSFKYYASKDYPGPDGVHSGWYILSHSVWVEAIVKYYDLPTSIEDNENEQIPSGFSLSQNYPNPFNAETDIRYQIADDRFPFPISLKIYNILGQEIRTLVNQEQNPGQYVLTWDGKDSSGKNVSSGIYFYHLSTGKNISQARRMMLLR